MPVKTRSSTKAETFESKESKAVVKNESVSKEEIESTNMAADAVKATNASTGKEEPESIVKALEVAVAKNLSGSEEELEAAIHAQQVQTNVAHITTVPNEIKLKILGHLGRVSSACLGVTCKSFYGFHRAKYGTVRLSTNEYGYTRDYVKGGETLANSLISWVPKEIQFYNYKDRVFVTEEEFEELVDEWCDQESRDFWRDNFPGFYPEPEDDQIRISYLDALREHGMEYEDWPEPREFVDDWLKSYVDDWLTLCDRKNWDPHSEDHYGSREKLMDNTGPRLEHYYSYSDTSEEDNGGEEEKVAAKIRSGAGGAPILPSFITKLPMSPRSITA